MSKQTVPEEQYEEEKGSWLKAVGDFFWELAKVVILSLAIIVPIRYFLFQPFYVRGASMEPNFFDHEYLIIDEISYGIRVPFTDMVFPFGDPTRGEIVVFRYPRDQRQFFIKRIIGLPGDTVNFDNGRVTIFNTVYPDGRVLEEPYIDSVPSRTGMTSITLGADEYFVMGDNRSASLDSRSFGSVKRSLIIGRTLFRGWPFNRITRFTPPSYNL
ncbi:MAG: signal peptidase I [bacterium]|nr:signal peptidase I [bacterium]